MKTYNYFFAILIAFIAFGCGNDDTSDDNMPTGLDPLEYYEELNISYGPDDDQKFDIYLPANRSTETKVLILVHGGGWTSGDKADMNGFRDIIRQDLPNVAIVNINYRLANATTPPYPMQIDDISAVVNHLKSIDNSYVFSDDYGFIGVSAGAHLSLLWSYAFDTGSDSKMVCSIVGPTNFTDPAYLENTDPAIQALLDLYGETASIAFLEEVSPYHQATSASPPTVMFYGGQDPLIPTTQGTDLRDRLDELGVTNEFTLYPNAGHGWAGLELLDTWLKLKLFINSHLE
ncbi:MAG TPA: alpha/beta hydrolase [Aquaticitalea sp.]|nr:alpha/beta hydrolase [Aquaticitalea sp.]